MTASSPVLSLIGNTPLIFDMAISDNHFDCCEGMESDHMRASPQCFQMIADDT